MNEYRGYKYQQNENDKWDVMYPENDSKRWVIDFETEAILKSWIDEKITIEENQRNTEDDITDLQLAMAELGMIIAGGAE